MYPELNMIITSNEFKNSMEGKKVDAKVNTKITCNQNTNSLKSPFSNLMLRKIIVHQKIKTLNQIKTRIIQQNKENTKKLFKQKNLYINFLDSKEHNKKNINENINDNNSKSNRFKVISDEYNFFKNIGGEGFSSSGKIFRNRNIRPLRLLPASKTIHNLKIKSYSKENSNQKIVYVNNHLFIYNKMNITINNSPKLLQLDEKTLRNTKRLLPKIQENYNFSKPNRRKQNIIDRNNLGSNTTKNSNSLNSLKIAQISIYEKNAPKILFKNKTNNSIITSNNENYKSISVGKIDKKLYNNIKIFKKEKINNLLESLKKEINLNNNSTSRNNKEDKKNIHIKNYKQSINIKDIIND